MVKGSAFLPLFVAAMTPFVVIALIVVATGLGLFAWQPPVIWSHLFGAGGSASEISSDQSGVYIQSYSYDPSLGPGIDRLFLSKYDPIDNAIWTRTMGDTKTSLINEMSVGPDGIYLSGKNYTQGIFLKYDLAGNKLWERDLAYGEVRAISAVRDGVYVIGVSPPVTNQSYSGLVSWVREYDLAGRVIWTNEFSNDTTYTEAVYASSSGVYVTYGALNRTQNLGPFLVKYGLTGTPVWVREPVGGALSGDSTGVYLAGGSLSKYDFNGSLVWSASMDSPDLTHISGVSVSVDSSGVYLSMSTIADHEFFSKHDLNGNLVWNLRMQDPVQDANGPTAFRVSAGSGAVYVAGSVRSSGGVWAMLAELSPSASLVFFGLNPPWSFMLLGGLIGGSGISVIMFRRLRRKRTRPFRVGPSQHTLPTAD